MSIATGTRLGQYEVQDFIGQGAMGVVYRAYHPELERTGAVKILQAISPDADTVARFRHEAQAIAQLRHPNIVNVYDFGAFQGTPYMIVEYIPGGSLAARMNQGKLDPATAVRILRGIAAGMDYAHQHGVVHRDIKPANVLLTAEDTPVLADFGLAKLLQGSSLKSMTGVTTGTPAYMAPEQVAGHQVGPAADRYSLATIAYEMLTGVIPFDGEALMELLYAQVHREPLPPSSRLPTLSPAVDAVILRGLAKDPAVCWESAKAFVDALEAALKGAPAPAPGPVPAVAPMEMSPLASTVPFAAAAVAERVAAARPQPATVAMPFPEPVSAAATATPPAQSQPRRRRRNVIIGVAAVLVLLLALGVCATLAQATTLTVSPNRAARGDTVTVKAAHVPANKAGLIELWSVVRTYPFQADSNGNVTFYLTVPRDTTLGDHEVKICWDNSCHQQAPLKVVAAVGEVLPTPVANQTPTGSPSAGPGGSPSPSSSATATPSHSSAPSSQPTSQPTSRPTSQPTSPPTSNPTPPNPCPGNSNALQLTPMSQTVLLGGNAKFTGSNFTPNSWVTVSYKQGTNAATGLPSVKASCGGGISVSVTVPGGLARTDHVIVCDISKSCVTETINVV